MKNTGLTLVRQAYALERALRHNDADHAVLAGQLLDSIRSSTVNGRNASSSLLSYLRAHAGEVVAGSTLAAVSGIADYARALRSLRERGWKIVTAGTLMTKNELQYLRSRGIDTIPNGSYVLISRHNKWR